jgi:hypothetical protein
MMPPRTVSEVNTMMSPELLTVVTTNAHKSKTAIDHYLAVVCIGTSNDEEEVMVPNNCESDGDVAVMENRNDEEYTLDDVQFADRLSTDERDLKGDDEIKQLVIEIDDQTSDLTDATEAEEQNTGDISSSPLKFGSHMIRDSVTTDEPCLVEQEVQAETDCSHEQSNLHDNSTADENPCCKLDKGYEPKCDKLLDESIENHLIGLVSDDNESYCSSNYTSEDSTPLEIKEEHPLKSILKKSEPIPPTSTKQSLFFAKVHKRSPKLKSFASFRKKRAVTFTSITLRTYDIILGDHPNCKFGAPISIGWDYEQRDILSLDIYEKCRGERRKMKRLYLNSGCRRKLLQRAGYSIEEISDTINDVQLIQMQRHESTEEIDDTPPFLRGADLALPQLDNWNMRGWNRNRKSRWSRLLEMLQSSHYKTRLSKF